MLHNHLKEGLRLNRTLGFSLLLCNVLALRGADGFRLLSGQLPGLSDNIFLVFSVLFLLLNELVLRSIKALNKPDELSLEKISLVLPLFSASYLMLTYALTGKPMVLLCFPVPILQAQWFGHRGQGMLLFLALGTLAGALSLFGYPGLALLTPWSVSLVALPFLLTLAHFGDIVAKWVRTASSRVHKLQSLATTDGLTGLINRRQFNARLEAETARTRRYRHPLSLALFDIDDFKKINDLYGHPTGDRILSELGKLIAQNVRESDIPARYGGEEFALILPETGQVHAYDLLERLRSLVEGTVFCLPDNPMTITLSVGVTHMDTAHTQAYELIAQADAALYDAKRQGKNRVIISRAAINTIPIPKPYAVKLAE